MSKHPDKVLGWDGTLEELAIAIENMRYDKTVEFLVHLAECFRKRSVEDRRMGRVSLSNALYNVYTRTSVVSEYVKDAWKVCQPYMTNK